MIKQLLLFKTKFRCTNISCCAYAEVGINLVISQYDIEYHSSAVHANADALFHLSRPITDNEESNIFYFSAVEQVPILTRDIQEAARRDAILSRALNYSQNGWPSHMDFVGELRP